MFVSQKITIKHALAHTHTLADRFNRPIPLHRRTKSNQFNLIQPLSTTRKYIYTHTHTHTLTHNNQKSAHTHKETEKNDKNKKNKQIHAEARNRIADNYLS